uniref:Uncharacterized protein n=1 Tax=Zonotrichia albicollis TaxID=44394 RepID=A0A8D2MFY2_ZONAL
MGRLPWGGAGEGEWVQPRKRRHPWPGNPRIFPGTLIPNPGVNSSGSGVLQFPPRDPNPTPTVLGHSPGVLSAPPQDPNPNLGSLSELPVSLSAHPQTTTPLPIWCPLWGCWKRYTPGPQPQSQDHPLPPAESSSPPMAQSHPKVPPAAPRTL